MTTTKDIFIFGEQTNGVPHRIAMELATGAATLTAESGGQAVGVVLGRGAKEAATALAGYGLDHIYYIAAADLSDYGPHAQAHALAAVLRERRPLAVLLPSTNDGRDVAGRLSAILDTGLLCNAARLFFDDGKLVSEEAAFDATMLIGCVVKDDDSTAVVTVRGKVYGAESSGSQAVLEELPYTASPAAQTVRVVEIVTKEADDAAPLEGANIIVAGGRGLGGPEGFGPLRELAASMGAALGASRAAVDAGWVPYAMQVGQTGKTVKPKAYLAIGISGAIQHKVGMQGSDAIIAINKDPEAPIFAFADLGIVGDLNQIVPRLTEEMRKRRS